MKTFRDLGVFAAFLAGHADEVQKAAEIGLAGGAAMIAEDARDRLGHYDQFGYPSWAQLTPGTQEERERLGYTPNDPLLRSRTLQSNVTSDADGRHAVAGVQHGAQEPDGADVGDVAVDMEFGTVRAPARPYLAPSGFVNAPRVAELVGEEVRLALAGERPHRRVPKPGGSGEPPF